MKNKSIAVSKTFRVQSFKAVLSILLFVLSYILLFGCIIALALLCIYFGILIMFTSKLSVLAIGVGICLISFGIINLFFFIKFGFSLPNNDQDSQLVEISENQEKELFSMIKEIAEKIGTSLPNKVYVNYEVGASAFYYSNFWSMFFPAKKNLMIGLGLVNSVTKEELKAIIAHELGHFSQRSMKIGSYVHQVNTIIHHMLYDDIIREKQIQSWANFSSLFSFFVLLTNKLFQTIIWILKQVYIIVNKNYSKLSREMEFHADEIAISITGYLPLKNSLLRMNFIEMCSDNVIEFYNNHITNGYQSKNLLKDHRSLIHFFTTRENIKIVNNLPHFELSEKTKLKIEDTWSSHPTIEERIQRMEKIGIGKEYFPDKMAKEWFSNLQEIENQVTINSFSNIDYDVEIIYLDENQFLEKFKNELTENEIPKIFNGYYDKKSVLAIENIEECPNDENFTINELFSEVNVKMVNEHIELKNIIMNIELFINNQLDVKTIEYNGKNYNKKQAKELIKLIHTEEREISNKIEINDKRIFNFFKREAIKQNKMDAFDNYYKDAWMFFHQYESKLDFYNEIKEDLIFLEHKHTENEIIEKFKKFLNKEIVFKKEITDLMTDPFLTSVITDEMRDEFQKFSTQNIIYFKDGQYMDDNLKLLFDILSLYEFLLYMKNTLIEKNILDFQHKLVMNNQTNIIPEQ